MNLDLSTYAERLAKAMPERFRLSEIASPIGWALEDWDRLGSPFFCENSVEFKEDTWAFFGPLLDEFDISLSDVAFPYADPKHVHMNGTWLESVAEAVCRAAEAKAKEESQ